jgi:DNA-binding IclR family transcriptional regulator
MTSESTVALRAPSGTQAIQRAVNVLRELGKSGQRGLRIVDLSRRLSLERPTLHRILRCLVGEGLIAHDAQTKRYLLGPTIFELGIIVSPRFNLRDLCELTLDRIRAQTGDTVFLTVRSGDDGLVIDRREGSTPIRAMPLEIGSRRPLGVGSSGLALAMGLPDEEVRQIVARSAQRLNEHRLKPASVLANIRKARELGHGYSRGYGYPGISGLALPLRNLHGALLGAISVTAISSRMTRDHRHTVLTVLQREIDNLQKHLMLSNS